MVLGISFLAFTNTNFQFGIEELTWRTYIIAEALPITSWVKLIDKMEFAKAALDKNSETFVVHVSVLEATENSIHPSQIAQIAALQ